MAEPLNIRNEVRHYLRFVTNNDGRFEIDEPFGFDGVDFVVKQESGRYGRDVSLAGGEVDFTFVNQENILGHKFDLLVEYYQIYGYEADVVYELSVDGGDTYYVIGNLDFETAETDQILSFSCQVIQETPQAIIKRRLNTKINLFGDTDLDGNSIEPVETVRMLLKAKPVIQESEWFVPAPLVIITRNIVGTETPRFSAINAISLSGIPDTLSWIMDGDTQPEDIRLIASTTDLSNLTLTFADVTIIRGDGSGSLSLRYRVGEDYNTAPTVIVETYGNEVMDWSGTVTIPVIGNGENLWVYFQDDTTSTPISSVLHQSGTLNIQGTSTAIDSVTSAVRLNDAMNQVVENMNQDFSFVAPRFERSGEWYNQFVFNGNLIRLLEDRAYVMSFKQILESMQELNCDYEINGNTVSMLKYDDFYTDNEMIAFEIAPSSEFKTLFNERYAINRFNWIYETFNQDEDDDNTDSAVHTEVNFNIRHRQVENEKEIKIPFIRDHFMIETTRIKGISETPTTSLSQDDKTFIVDALPLPPNTMGNFSARFTHRVNEDGNLLLLNDGSFNWIVLGFQEGDRFEINNTDNDGDYEVDLIETNLLTLTPILGTAPASIGEAITTITYPLTDVDFVMRTDEGFTLIENVIGADDFANLLYTPKRNILNNWGSYLNTASLYTDEPIQSVYFKNGGALVTQFQGETTSITENADIQRSDLATALLDPKRVETKVIANFEQFMQLSNLIKTVRGYVTIRDNNGRNRAVYPQQLTYNWEENLLTIEGELRAESLFTNITRTEGVYTITRDGYDDVTTEELEYETFNQYITFFNSDNVNLTERLRVDFVQVNGVSFSNGVELTTAIEQL